jgi:hypothetical protein
VPVAPVTFIEGDNQRGLPALGGQAIEAESIVSRVERGGIKMPAEGFLNAVETDQGRDTIMTVTVGHGDEQGQLAGMAEVVGG